MALLVASVVSVGVINDTAQARGPEYSGPQTASSGPAYFGPAPNPFPYCDSPTYFDPFPENVNPIGRMDIGDTASVTTDGVTMDLVITSEGNDGDQYPGFFPEGGDGGSGDQPKGIELAEGDGASVTLSAPLFYSQWIFTDVDQPNEGFTVTPKWTVPGQAAAFGGDEQFTFAGTTSQAVELDDLDGQGQVSESINGRVQVDFLGAVTGIDMLRTFPSSGQSGFAVGGGCEAAGAAKVVVAGPTWNGTSFDVTYELRMRNNLPSSSTIQSVIDDAVAAVGASLVTGDVEGIDLADLQLTDDLRDPAFSAIEVTGRSATGNLVLNDNFDGVTDFELISGGSIAAESDEVITLSVQYTPDLSTNNWSDCQAGYDYLNQTEVTGTASNVAVSDLSDDGFSAAPSDNNGSGGVDDPTPVNFPCLPGGLEIVKTAVPGPNGICPTFENGVPGDGDALAVTVDDVVTYCVSVRNPGPGPITDVSVADAQAPGTLTLNDLGAGETDTVSYDVTVAISTPPQNTATATANDVNGPIDPVQDTALIEPTPKDQPLLEIVKTVLAGPNGTCPTFENGIDGLGPALAVLDGQSVTYCVSVRNVGPGDATNVVISDPQAPRDFPVGTLLTDQGATESYDLTVDIDTTAEVNVATATYSGPDGQRDPVSDNAQIDILPLQPNLEIVKTVIPGPNGTCPSFVNGVPGLGTALAVDDRDIVTYCVSVRNNGAGVATDVEVRDDQAPGVLAIGTLASGAEDTVRYDVLVDIDTTPDVNTAVASGNGPDGPLDDVEDQAQISIDALPNPTLQIVKTAVREGTSCPDFDGGTAGLGAAVQFVETETVTFCITVRNIGPGPATAVVIADDQAPNTFDLNIGDLAVDQAVTRSYNVENLTVNSPTTNIAQASGQGLNGAVGPVEDPALINVSRQADPVLEIVKTVVPGPDGTCPANFAGGTPGDGDALGVLYEQAVTFCITVRNTGGNPATSVTVTDDQAPATLQLGTIPVGEERSGKYDVTVDDSTPEQNTATANGVGPNGAVPSVDDTALIDPSPQPNPVLEIVKTVVPGPNGTCPANFAGGTPGDGEALVVQYGTPVTFCISVQNTGENPAQNVIVADAQAPASINFGTLGVNEEKSESYDVLVTSATEPQNTATVNGTGPNGALIPASDTALIVPDVAVLEIVKTVVPGPQGDCPSFDDGVVGEGDALPVLYGDIVTYCISVKNAGGNPATAVRIDDAQAPQVYAIGTLAPGQVVDRTYDLPAVTADTPERNVASVSGTGPNDVDLGPVTDPANISSSPQPEPTLEIVKTVVPGPNGTCPSFENGVPGPGTPLPVDLDDTVTYCVSIRNTGLGDANDVKITDEQSPVGEYIVGLLASGEGHSEQYDVVAAIDVPETNTAVVTGTGPTGDLRAQDDAIINRNDTRIATISLIHSVAKGDDECITASKTLNSRVADRQDFPITWCALVTNTGNVHLTNVELTAPDIGLDGVDVLADSGSLVLAPQASIKLNVAGTIPNEGMISNALVVGDPSDAQGNLLSNIDSPEDVDNADVLEAEINLETTVIAGASADVDCDDATEEALVPIGDDVTWCFAVTNTGPVDLEVLKVNDVTLGIEVAIPADQQRIAPGVTVVVKATTVSTGDLTNDADVRGRPLNFNGQPIENAPEVEDADPASVITPRADLSIVKSVSDAGPVSVGAVLTYTLVITNNGPHTAEDVKITDALPAGLTYATLPGDADWGCLLDEGERGFSCGKVTDMENGATATLTYTVNATSTAPLGAALVNTATVSSSTPDDDDTNNDDDATTEVETPDEVVPTTERPEYPGPFTPPAPPLALPPDEVLGLAITGSSTGLLATLSAAMLALGGTMMVGARRNRRDDY